MKLALWACFCGLWGRSRKRNIRQKQRRILDLLKAGGGEGEGGGIITAANPVKNGWWWHQSRTLLPPPIALSACSAFTTMSIKTTKNMGKRGDRNLVSAHSSRQQLEGSFLLLLFFARKKTPEGCVGKEARKEMREEEKRAGAKIFPPHSHGEDRR